MKNYLILFTLLLNPLFGWGQAPAIQHFYDKYKSMEQVQDIRLQGWVLELASKFSDEEAGEKLLRKITQLRVLIMEEGNLVSPGEYKTLLRDVKRASFQELIKVKEEGQHVDLLIREQGDTITDVLVVISGTDGFVLLSLEGALKFSDLNDLNIDVKGADQFKKLPEKKSDIPQA